MHSSRKPIITFLLNLVVFIGIILLISLAAYLWYKRVLEVLVPIQSP